MNKHAWAMAACLALQPVFALGAKTLIRPDVGERNGNQSYETQRNRRKQADVAKSCIWMRLRAFFRRFHVRANARR
ncbi:MAG: hypothetical protein IT521_07085 [Burkholderiales bacterium]|nr:hypothetical protein [Burkholderiales bacterium]